jgi:hypothetical protein
MRLAKRTCVHGVFARHEGAARRGAYWQDVVVVEYDTAVRQSVDVRRWHLV